jgi:uncharacterized protein
MQQFSRTRTVLLHLYPGILITFLFVLLTPLLLTQRYPPQFSLLIATLLIGIPVLYLHLSVVKKEENANSFTGINKFRNKLPNGKLILYCSGLVIYAFLIWGLTQPLNNLISRRLLAWLPTWYTVQDFTGYSKAVVLQTLILNLLINGSIAPLMEEYYFRGYLLPRMKVWGKWAFVVNTVFFSLYHFWQPQIWLTLILSLIPMCYLVWKTEDLRVGIYTHCLLNILGALLSFGLVLQ